MAAAVEPGHDDHDAMRNDDVVDEADLPVLVVGGGPSGLAAAAELALHGVRSIVLEPRVEVAHSRPRAKTTSVRTMEHLRRWNVADAVRETAPLKVAWSQRVIFCDSLSGHEITHFDGAFGLSTDRTDISPESGQQVPQPVVEEVLRAHVAASSVVDLRLGWSALGLERHDDHWTVIAQDQDGEQHRLTARYVLGCDGAAGVVRKSIGARYVGQSDGRPNFNIVFRAPDLEPALDDAVQYWVVGETVSGLMGRLDLDGAWWAILPGVDGAVDACRTRELLTALVGRPFDFEVVATDEWTARMLVADRFQLDNVFLVGEAAHLNPPWGGHGYNTSIGDAVNIAWKIAAVESGWAHPGLLLSYEAERRTVVEEIVATARQNMSALPGDLSADADAIHAAKAPEFYSLGLVLGYQYWNSPIVQPTASDPFQLDPQRYQPTLAPGARLPHQWLADGASLFDRLGTGFTLLVPPGQLPASRRFVDDAAAADLRLSLLEVPDTYPWRDKWILVRPDQHVAWVASSVEEIDLLRVGGLAALPVSAG
jgi:2-polyprenyl-6-methoxyphenol hydroxylase-like FAD-dependent oxidoreductase